ncbi:efflux RND transporter permease subunit [uncultured Cyclobacterium sp.]|uniref:efflux RND transporter permease subunit n=1 Tax=uncultured Cyclobacterium sp. TaxID=453820 RepID=UPI0030ED2364|tara:strand:- start:242413 stop:245514 length:3102 start_codon:yes stop_codon:yes gene_type:complete
MTPFRLVILFFVVSIIGIALIPKLSVDLNPPEKEPILNISYGVRNASPELVEKLATSPLEGAFTQLSELKKTTSESNYNAGNIQLRFDKNTDMDYKKFEVAALIRQVFPSLDSKVSYPNVTQSSQKSIQEKKPILTYSINGPFASFEIKKIAEDILVTGLNSLEEIETIEIRGANELYLYVIYDIQKLQSLKFSRSSLENRIRNSFGRNYPGLAMNNSGDSMFLEIDRSIADKTALENLLLGRVEGKAIYLKDVATLTLQESAPQRFYRINGNNSVNLTITNRDGVNKVLLAQKIKELMVASEVNLPEGFDVRLEFDDTSFLDKELKKIYKRSGLSILILVVFIFLINRNFKYLLTLFLGIIVNVSLTVIILYLLKVNIHMYSLAGLTISFGLIVDNAIIMIDHLHKHKNRKVFLALLAASLTTIVALLMVFLLPEDDRRNLGEFSVVVAVMLGVSLLVALLFTPAMYDLLFGEKQKAIKRLTMPQLRKRVVAFSRFSRFIGFTAKFRKSFIVLLILLFGLPVFYLPSTWEGQEWYNKTVGNSYYQEEIRPYVDKSLGGSFRMFVRGVFEKSSYREAERTRLYVNATLPFGNTLAQMNFIMTEFELFLKGVEGVDKFVTTVSSGQNARIEITFKEAHETSALPYRLKGKLAMKSTDWSGVRWGIYGVGQGFSTGPGGEGIPSFRAELRGYNYSELEKQSEILAEKLLSHRRIQEVNTNERRGWNEKKTEEYVLRFDQKLLAMAGANQYEVVNALNDLSQHEQPSLFLEVDNNKYGVVVKEKESDRFSKFDIENSSLISSEDKIFKVSGFGSLNKESTTNALHKEDRQYIRLVSFDYMGSAKFGGEYLDEVMEEMKAGMPIGYSISKQSYNWNYDKAKRQYGLLLVLIVGIFFICSILFENFKQPLYIIFIIPISFIGLFLIFSLFDFYFDQGGYAAFVMLGGLAVNAAIFIVNDLNNRSKGNYNRNVLKAVGGKATPILLTVLSTCFGLIPFVMEGQGEIFWFSLAIGTIGGLVFSMVGVFLALPVFLWKRNG